MISDPAALLEGDLELVGLMPAASNYTFLARLGPAPEDTAPLVVYKPRRGESPLWDFPSGTLCQREAAAFLVSRAGGFDVVPPTVLREGPYGIGSVQAFVEHDFDCTAFDLYDDHAPALRRIALLDVVINNADRKAGHVFPDGNGHVWGIDHGICFHAEPKLRTVLWDFAGEVITDKERACLRRLEAALGLDEGLGEDLGEDPNEGLDATVLSLDEDRHEGGGEGPGGPGALTELGAALAGLLDAQELQALRHRLRAALAAAVFPNPGPGRAFPWPPI